MNAVKAIIVLFITSLVIFTSGCTSFIRDDSYTLRFLVNETGEPLEGTVSNNDNLLGYARNGNITTNIEKLRPGLISLNGTYDGQQFDFYFEFPAGSLNYSSMGFSVRTDELRSALFNASVLDVPGLEREVFSLVNEERRKGDIKALKWNDGIAQIARNYGKTLSIGGFHHKDVEGKDAGDRLKENKIFYTVAAENLFMLSGLNSSANISKTVVDGWMNSPGHRSPIMDRDELFSDGGVGMYCEKKTCYAVMVFAGMEHNENMELNPGYVAFRYLYDPTYPFDFDVPVSIDVDSTEYINFYIVSGKDQYDNFVNDKRYSTVSENKQTKKLSSKITASKGESVIIESPRNGNSAKINIHIRYS